MTITQSPETPFQRIMDALHNCSEFKLTCPDQYGDWTAEFAYDRCHFEGRGDTPEAALLEALVDRRIADHYYAADADAPSLTPEQMTEWLHGAYRAYLGHTPDHEYRGEYLESADEPEGGRKAQAPDYPGGRTCCFDSLNESEVLPGHDADCPDAVALASLSPIPLDSLPAYINALLRRTDSPFVLGDSVRKRPGGGEWRGVVVGLYLASKTPLGFAVESVREPGSVQIYPARALQEWPRED